MAVRSTTRVVLSMAEQHAGRLLRTSLELEDMTPRRPSKRGDDGARGRSVGWVSSVVLCEKKKRSEASLFTTTPLSQPDGTERMHEARR